ncbi:hypothetical protein J3459_013640 [Metarhizium acridum]|nr:hypothetical protein J3459_013640 [Metarhizium acridum]
MSEFASFGGSDEEYASVRKHQAEVEADPDNFDSWENYIKSSETLDAYDRFLHKFPLLFDIGRKYADMEFNIAGPESAEMVYERAVLASPTPSTCGPTIVPSKWKRHMTPRSSENLHSVAIDTCAGSVDVLLLIHSLPLIALMPLTPIDDLRNGVALFFGLDFLAHPFWDKYIEYEERQEAQDRIYAIHARVIRIPMHQYARYYERFRNLAHTRPLAEVVPADVLSRFPSRGRGRISSSGGGARPELEIERDIRAKIDAMYYEVFTATQQEVSKRWT